MIGLQMTEPVANNRTSHAELSATLVDHVRLISLVRVNTQFWCLEERYVGGLGRMQS